jgi:hypothetical protein
MGAAACVQLVRFVIDSLWLLACGVFAVVRIWSEVGWEAGVTALLVVFAWLVSAASQKMQR